MLTPLILQTIKAGFPSPADDFYDTKLDLNEYLIKHPAATYFIRVSGSSMKNAGITSGDLLIVDRSLETRNGDIVVASINGEFTLKRIKKINSYLYLVAENSTFKPIKINLEDDFQIFGVVKHVIKTLV